MSGSGGGGGYEYQAMATAYVAAHILAQQCLRWIADDGNDVPVAVEEETNGPGDDLCIKLQDGTQIELQAKHGLQKNKLWEPLVKLVRGLQENPQLYGVLLTDTTASPKIRYDLLNDLKRLGQERTDDLKAISQELQEKFTEAGLPTDNPDLFRRLRIVVLDLDDGLQDGKQAQLVLSQILQDSNQSAIVWKSLCQEGQKLLSNRGKRDARAWARLLSNQGIQLTSPCAEMNGVRSSSEIKYLETIQTRHELWWKNYAFIDDIDESTWHEFGLSVTLSRSKNRADSTSKPDEKDHQIPLQILSALKQISDQQVLIVGKPGAGKSTFLTHLLLEKAKEALDNPTHPIPVLIRLSSIDQLPEANQGDVKYWIKNALEHYDFLFGLSEQDKLSYIENLLKDKRLCLLIDAVNELIINKATKVLKSLCSRDLPMILTTRDRYSTSLRIKTELEIQPLEEEDVKKFFEKHLPNRQNQIIELCDRVRDFGQTPLMVWMLYSVFSKTDKIPETRGAIYREFVELYSREKCLENINNLHAQLAKLAFEMIHSEQPLYEKQIQKTLGTNPHPNLLNHLLQADNARSGSRKLEFCHQSLQEYFAAEHLLLQLDELIQEQPGQQYTSFQTQYLNYLKWTEAIALMLGLAELNNSYQVEKIVEQALVLDYRLGARLTSEVHLELQPRVIKLVAKQSVPEWFRILLLGETKSPEIVDEFMKIFEHSDSEMRGKVIWASRQLSSRWVEPLISRAIKDPDPTIREITIRTVAEVDLKEATSLAVKILPQEKSSSVREVAVICVLDRSDSEEVILELMRLMQDETEDDISSTAFHCISKKDETKVISIATNTLRNKNSSILLRRSAAKLLGELGDERNLSDLRDAEKDLDLDLDLSVEASWSLHKLNNQEIDSLKNSREQRELQVDFWRQHQDAEDPIERGNAVYYLSNLLDREEALLLVKSSLQDSHHYVRGHAIGSLTKLIDKDAIPQLLIALEDDHYEVRDKASRQLRNLKASYSEDLDISKESIYKLAQIISNEYNDNVLCTMINTFTNLCCVDSRLTLDEALEEVFLNASKSQNKNLRMKAARGLGKFNSKSSATRLLEMMKDEVSPISLSVSEALKEISSEITKQFLPKLMKLILESPKVTDKAYFILGVISSIQGNCGLYNYEIDQQAQDNRETSNQLAQKKLGTSPSIIQIGQVGSLHLNQAGNLNIGDVKIHGDQIGIQHNNIEPQEDTRT